MMIDGGISSPSVPAPARVPTVISSGYPRFLSSGSVILPIVAQVAADEPDTAAKIVQPMILVCRSRPGTRSSHGASPLNMSSESRVRKRISPIHTNSGSAVSVHDDVVPQIVSAIASPAERDEKSSIAIHATPNSARPIQTPAPSRMKRPATSVIVTRRSMRRSGLFDVQRFDAGLRFDAAAAKLELELVDDCQGEYDGAKRHSHVRKPKWRCVVASRDVLP